MTIDDDLDIPNSGAVFTFGKSRFADNAPSKFWIKNDQITDVACGDEHTAVLTATGRLFMIGSNDLGQLGLDSYKPISKPSCVKALKPSRVLKVSCGRAHSVASCEDGSVYSWGHNDAGQLGIGDKRDRATPTLVMRAGNPPRDLSAGSSHSALVTADGTVLVWGGNSEGQLGLEVTEALSPVLLALDQQIVAVECGYYHTVVLTVKGEVVVWGECEAGQLGLPVKQHKLHRIPQVLALQHTVIDIAAGNKHTLLLTSKGHILSCGRGNYGQLGQGESVDCQTEPCLVDLTPDITFTAVSAGDTHSAALSSNGQVYTWGCGRHGKLGLGEHNLAAQYTPVPLTRLRHLTAALVGCGGCHTMVLGYPSSAIAPSVHGNRLLGRGQMLPPLRSAASLPPIRAAVAAAPGTPDIVEQATLLPDFRPDDAASATDPEADRATLENDILKVSVVESSPDHFALPIEGEQGTEVHDVEEGTDNSGGTEQATEGLDEQLKNAEDEANEEDDVHVADTKPEKKGNALRRLFSSWGRKKTSIEVIEEAPHEEETDTEKADEVMPSSTLLTVGAMDAPHTKDGVPVLLEASEEPTSGACVAKPPGSVETDPTDTTREGGFSLAVPPGDEYYKPGVNFEDSAVGDAAFQGAPDLIPSQGIGQKFRLLRKVNNITDGHLEEAHPPDSAHMQVTSSPTHISSTEVTKSRACVIL